MNQQDHSHVPYGRIYQTEHFNVLIKRCRFCDEFIGVETGIRQDVPPDPPKNIVVNESL